MVRGQFQKEQEATDEPPRKDTRPTDSGSQYDCRVVIKIDDRTCCLMGK